MQQRAHGAALVENSRPARERSSRSVDTAIADTDHHILVISALLHALGIA